MPAMKTESTTLNLLAGDGFIRVTFTPALNTSQYGQLLESVRKHDGQRDDLSSVLQQLAAMWSCAVLMEEF